jgi:hypothetical protein
MKLDSYLYTANFCEENIWQLCQHPSLAAFTKTVLFISNEQRNCPLWHQKSSLGDDPVWWDYHVTLIVSSAEASFIFDFDTNLNLPSPLIEYLQHTFRPDLAVSKEDRPLFKTIPSLEFIQKFDSDRIHMLNDAGEWKSTPPNWPMIKSTEGLTLSKLLDFSVTSEQRMYSLDEVRGMFSEDAGQEDKKTSDKG